MTTHNLLGTVFSLLISLAAVSTAGAKEDNEFTSSAEDKGKVLEKGEDSIKIEFPGLAGYKVIFSEVHGRSWLDLSFEGKSTDLMNDIFNACPGVWPIKANDVVQWRGTRSEGKFIPYAVIFRMGSNVEDESKTKRSETLIVIKLDGGNSKVVGNVASDKGGNEAAEALADKLCGPKSIRRHKHP